VGLIPARTRFPAIGEIRVGMIAKRV